MPTNYNKPILSVFELLTMDGLTIPDYQRPYKWTEKNVTRLLDDIVTHQNKSAYRLGTIVFHQEEDKLNIVDGQQRTITLLLIVKAIIDKRLNQFKRDDLKNLDIFKNKNLFNPKFSHPISQMNIKNNYSEICRFIQRPECSEELIDFFLKKCELVTFTLTDISEAFQFFDSQNSRGKDLRPHDLLKAFHLREFSQADNKLTKQTVDKWENTDSQQLGDVFSQYLYFIRSWIKGEKPRYFEKKDTDLFKGINLGKVKNYPYIQQLQIVHHFTHHYNQQFERHIDNRPMDFPFQIDQPIINGRRFFEMISHYLQKIEIYQQSLSDNEPSGYFYDLEDNAKKILKTLNEYEGRKRTGDGYVHIVFDCLLIYYMDKFGTAELSRAIEKIFIWAYSIRLKMQLIPFETINKNIAENNLFIILKNAIEPKDFINTNLPIITENRSSKTTDIVKLFTDMGYLINENEQEG